VNPKGEVGVKRITFGRMLRIGDKRSHNNKSSSLNVTLPSLHNCPKKAMTTLYSGCFSHKLRQTELWPCQMGADEIKTALTLPLPLPKPQPPSTAPPPCRCFHWNSIKLTNMRWPGDEMRMTGRRICERTNIGDTSVHTHTYIHTYVQIMTLLEIHQCRDIQLCHKS